MQQPRAPPRALVELATHCAGLSLSRRHGSRGGHGRLFLCLADGGWQYGAPGQHDLLYLQATTACLSAIIVMQVVNVFCCRSDRSSALTFRLSSNPLLLWGIAIELLLIIAIDYTSWGMCSSAPPPFPPGSGCLPSPLPSAC